MEVAANVCLKTNIQQKVSNVTVSFLLVEVFCESPTPICLWVENQCGANADVKTMACVGMDKQVGWVALHLCLCMCMSEV